MKNTSILNRIIGLALSLALLVSMMPVLASEVYATGAGESVRIYKEDGSEASSTTDYTIDGNGVRYNLNTDNLTVTTNGFVVNACFALNSGVNNVTFENCRVFLNDGYIIQGDENAHNQTINISGDCDFMCNNGGVAMLFECTSGHEIIFTSSDRNNSLDIENYGRVIQVNNGGSSFTGEVNATITGNAYPNFIQIGEYLKIKNNADVKVYNSFEHATESSEGITIGGGMYMAGNSNLEVHSNGTAIAMQKGLLVRENASLSADSYHFTVVTTREEAEFDTTGRVQLTNYHSDGLLCKNLKVLNREGTVLIRGTESTAIKLINEGDITLGNKVKMYGSTDLNEPEKSIKKEFVNVKWDNTRDIFNYYHPYFVIDGDDTAIKAILIKGVTETPGGGGGTVDSGEIEKLREDLTSADAKIKELDGQVQELVKTLMKTKTKVSKLKSTAKRKVTLKFNKIPGAQKYEIKYKQSGQKWKTVTTKSASKTFKKLKSGKKFYAKVRGIFEKGTLRVTSPWSKTKSVKVK